ncbi:MAG: cytochrome c, partial [Chromatocurvus sp.]
HADYLALQLRAFRDGERYTPAMDPYIYDLTDDDIESLANYYAAQTPVVAANGDSDLVNRGQQLSGSCSACHGYAGVPVATRWPVLAGQHAPYLQQQLSRYKTEERIHPLMQAALANIDAVNFAALAAYYSQLER